MARFIANVTHFFITIYVVTVQMGAVHGNTENQVMCDIMASIAEHESSSSKNCTVRATDCTIMDCSSALSISRTEHPMFLDKDIYISFCFGIQIHDCSDPLSMDFYAQAPLRNRSIILTITRDSHYDWIELKENLGYMRTVYPVFIFGFKKAWDSILCLYVNLYVKIVSKFEDIPFRRVNIPLVHKYCIPLNHCNITVNITDKTSDTFAPDMCKFKSYIMSTTVVPVDEDRLNKSCDLDRILCGPKEICDMTLIQPKCICRPKFKLNVKRDACIMSSKFNMPCGFSEECGINELCRVHPLSNRLLCQCKEMYTYSERKDMCIFRPPRDLTEFKVNTKGDACIFSRRLNQPCGHSDECGINEVCIENKFNNDSFCQCRENYFYSAQKDICAGPLPINYTALILVWEGLATFIVIGMIICCVKYCIQCCNQYKSRPSESSLISEIYDELLMML